MRPLLFPFRVNVSLMLRVHDFDSRVDLPIFSGSVAVVLAPLTRFLAWVGGVMDCGNRAGF